MLSHAESDDLSSWINLHAFCLTPLPQHASTPWPSFAANGWNMDETGMIWIVGLWISRPMFEPVRQHVSCLSRRSWQWLPVTSGSVGWVYVNADVTRTALFCSFTRWLYRATQAKGEKLQITTVRPITEPMHRIRTPTIKHLCDRNNGSRSSKEPKAQPCTKTYKNQAKNCLPVSVKKGNTMKNVVPPNCKSSNIPSNATAIGRLSGLCALSWRWPCMAQRDPMPWQILTTIELTQMMYMMSMIYIIILMCILAIVSYRMIQHCLFSSMGKRQTVNETLT